MPQVIDLKDFIGVIETEGATNLRHGMGQDGSLTEPAPNCLDTRSLWRYLYSDTPFIVTGKQMEEGHRHSEKVCSCK